MKEYLMPLGTIVLICISIRNIVSFKIKLKEAIAIITLVIIISSLLVNTSEFLAMIPMTIIPIIYIYIKSKNIYESISIPLTSIIIAVLLDYLVTNGYVLLFGGDAAMIRENPNLYWRIVVIGWLLMQFISKFLGFLLNKKIKISNLDIKGKFGLLAVISLLLTVVIFYINIIFESRVSSRNNIVKINGILFFSYFFLLMIVMYILLKNIIKELEFKNKQKQFESLKEYTDNLEKLYSEMRVFRHDYINILSSMIGYMQNEDMEGLEKFFNEKIVPLSVGIEKNNFKLGLLTNIKIPEIKGIFSSKLIRAQELGIDVFIDIAEPIERLDMDIIDISKAVGILLDNAIEAVENSQKPSIKIGLINKKNSVLIAIINNCEEEVQIYKIYQNGFSTKGEDRGLGLNNLKKILGEYTNVSLDTLIENGEFKQFLEIANK